jgi:hypothetical protein
MKHSLNVSSSLVKHERYDCLKYTTNISQTQVATAGIPPFSTGRQADHRIGHLVEFQVEVYAQAAYLRAGFWNS